MANEPHPDALVLRFRPMSDLQRLLDRAAQDARRTGGNGHHTASVWADAARDDEDRDAVIDRLMRATELHGVNPRTNPDYWFCSSAAKITSLGFVFEKDEYPGEPDEHYSVILGSPPSIEDAKRFTSAFTKERRRERDD